MKERENIEERDLWSNFLQGDNHCLEVLYRRYFDELYAFGMKWLNNSTLTEDSIQDLFIKLMRNRSTVSVPVSVRYYLFRAFRSVVLDKLKVSNRFQVIDEPGAHLFPMELSVEKRIVKTEEDLYLQKRLAAALELLTPRQREAIFLRFTEGFSYQQISELMGLSTKGTYKLMARAIDSLKKQLPDMAVLVSFLLYWGSFTE